MKSNKEKKKGKHSAKNPKHPYSFLRLGVFIFGKKSHFGL